MNARAALATAALLAITAPAAMGAQLTGADAALASGRLPRAESLFYLQASRQPRDPVSRAALGRYLAARGAFRVGAVLLEEARMFGGDPRAIALDLAPIYRELGDWSALATLSSSPLSAGAQEQARWLVSHGRTIAMPDSATITYRTPSDTGSLGEITIRVGDRALTATIDARRVGVVLDRRLRSSRGVRLFERAGRNDSVKAALREVGIGDLTLENVAATFTDLAGESRAVVGLDVLRALAPRFEGDRGRLVLHRAGRVRADAPGTRYPTLTGDGGVRVLVDGRFVSLAGGDMRERLLTRRWTLDTRRGEIVIE